VSRAAGLVAALAGLVLVALVSVAVGTKSISLADVVRGLLHDDGSRNAVIVRDLRLPRTVVGLAVGVALGVAGALMQALTRNPLADPGLLGLNAGAAAAVVVAIGFLGLSSPAAYVWFAFAGAAAAGVLVYALGSGGRSGATPVRLALAGTAIAAALTSFVHGITLTNRDVFNEYRFWDVGSLAGRDFDILARVGPFLLLGLLIAFALARPLNAIALGDDVGRGLGAHLGRTRALGAVATTLLCGGATAIAGPIAFVGLTVPHAARAIAGPDQRWVLPYAVVLAPTLVLGSDVFGRVVVPPSELEVGIVTALLGAPVFIALVRQKRIVQL
jgi:iron-siderophore transport system permease protein